MAKDVKPHPMKSSPGAQGRPSWGRRGGGSSASPSEEVSAFAAARWRGCQTPGGLEVQSGFWNGSLEPQAALKEFKQRVDTSRFAYEKHDRGCCAEAGRCELGIEGAVAGTGVTMDPSCRGRAGTS